MCRQASGSADFPVACVVPCLPWRVRPGCTLQLCRSTCASSTTATLGMNCWLGFIHQGLPPWKKRQASLGAPTEWLTLLRVAGRQRWDWQDSFSIMAHSGKPRLYASGGAAACLHPVLTGVLGARLPPLFGGPRVRCLSHVLCGRAGVGHNGY